MAELTAVDVNQAPLRKSRTRDPLATDYGWHVMRGRRRVARFTEIGDLERWLSGEGRES